MPEFIFTVVENYQIHFQGEELSKMGNVQMTHLQPALLTKLVKGLEKLLNMQRNESYLTMKNFQPIVI